MPVMVKLKGLFTLTFTLNLNLGEFTVPLTISEQSSLLICLFFFPSVLIY